MKNSIEAKESRRAFLIKSGMLITTASLSGVGCLGSSEKERKTWKIPPTEDLMRDHGVLRRIMLVYDEVARRLKQGEEFPLRVLTESNDLVRRYMQDYHEENEQFHVFNWLAQAGKLVELVAILYQQHLAGRKLVEKIKTLSTEENLKNPAERVKVAEYLATFNQTYRHHAAWEDTLVFPAFRAVISPQDFNAVGETFDKEKKKLFGADAYEKIIGQIADMEKVLGIHDMKQYIPKLNA